MPRPGIQTPTTATPRRTALQRGESLICALVGPETDRRIKRGGQAGGEVCHGRVQACVKHVVARRALRVHGKGRKERIVTLNYKACRALKAYLAVRPKIEDEALFLTKFEKPLGTRSIRNVVAKYLAEAGIAGASADALRHTFATHHVRKGTKLDVVRQALGHESLATTSVYVGLVREVMDQELQKNAL